VHQPWGLDGLHELGDFFFDLHILKAVLLTYAPQNIFLAAFLQFTSQKEFVEDEVCFLEVEDNIQLANIAIVFVHLFNVAVNDFKGDQFIIGGSTAGDEEKRSISTVDNFRVLVLKKIAHSSAPRKNELGDIFDDFGLFFRRKSGKPFCKSLFVADLRSAKSSMVGNRGERIPHTTLPCRDSKMR